MALTYPEHSFYKFSDSTEIGDHNEETPVDPCADEFELCLPVNTLKDIRFQVFSSNNALTTSGEGWKFGIAELDGTAISDGVSFEWNTFNWFDALDSGSIGLLANTFTQDIEDIIGAGNCFRLRIYKHDEIFYSKYCFQVVDDKCFTTRIRYYNNEDAYGFKYFYDNGGEATELGLINTVRLWFYCGQPQPKEKRTAYRLSTGDYRTTALTKEKLNECWTDSLPWDMHEKLNIALGHDNVSIINEEDVVERDIIQDGDYDIEWLDRREHPRLRVGQATFKLKDSPYANFNLNCNE